MRLFALNLQNRTEASETSMGDFLSFQGWKWLAVLVMAMMLPLGALAQLSGKGEITGTVTDKTGAVLPNATVTATNDATGTIVSTTTTGAGATVVG